MSGRHGYYMKTARRCTHPTSLFAVVVTPQYDRRTNSGRVQTARWWTAYAVHAKYRRGKWSKRSGILVTEPRALWEWLDANAARRGVNWVITPNVSETFTLTNWWTDASFKGITWRDVRQGNRGSERTHQGTGGIVVSQLLTRVNLGTVRYSERGVRWAWVSESNYWPDGCPAGCASEGNHRGDSEPNQRGNTGTTAPGCEYAHRLASALQSLCGWWREHALASFGSTTGQLAVGILRSHIPPKTLCTHNQDHVHKLEREAAHGGRVSLWFAGAVGGDVGRAGYGPTGDGEKVPRWIPGPIYQVDVRSMYPAIMRHELFPISLQSYSEDIKPAELVAVSRDFALVARVTVRADRSEYPLRVGERLSYPLGTFTTTLTGPEITHLAECGEVLKVHAAAFYRSGRPFAGAVEALLDARAVAERAGKTVEAGHAKLLVNSIAGKMAQRAGGWSRRAEMDCPGQWGEHYEVFTDGRPRRRFRYVAGLCWEYVEDPTGRGPHTAAFAYIAAHGRLQMARLRALCPTRSVICQQTDSLWVTAEGAAALSLDHCGGEVAAGGIRLVGRADTARFFAPGCYEVDGKWCLAGFHNPTVASDGRTVYDTYKPSVWQWKEDTPPDCVHVMTRVSRLTTGSLDGVIGPDGWVTPVNLSPG